MTHQEAAETPYVTPEMLQAAIDAQQGNSDHIWTMVAAALVLMMQLGFLFVEGGMVRSKNSINVAQKNVADLLMSVTVFYFIGFAIMFGPSLGGLFGGLQGLAAFESMPDWNYTFFVFQAVFVGTASTIVSGAVAERMKFDVYLLIAGAVSLFIYPVFGHWAWGNLLIANNAAWLADLGFIDFAGSTVVHSVGAWVGLAAAGGIILFVGWIGFNGGSTSAGTPGFARIIANTVIAATCGGLLALIIGRIKDGLYEPRRSLNGMLGGLVGITAGCDAVGPHGAAIIGACCGLLSVASEDFIERKLKLDDAVGAVTVRGVCGAFGTIMLAFFAMPEKLAAASALQQAGIQTLGVVVCFVWTFGSAFTIFKLIDKMYGIRVSREDEINGLNATEHGASLGTGTLQTQLADITSAGIDLRKRPDEGSGDEAADIAAAVNPFLDHVSTLVTEIISETRAMETASYNLGELSDRLLLRLSEQADTAAETGKSLGRESERLNGNAQCVLDMALEMKEEVARINGASQAMSDGIRNVSDSAQSLTRSVQTVSSSASASNDVATNATKLADSAAAVMETLSQSAAEIEGVVSFIEGVAGQTNLLALNATIEAARAGEAGKGFAVVAGEVKQLATRTSEAAG